MVSVMHPYPHHYTVLATGTPTGVTELSADGVPPLQAAAPPQFDGPDGLWSPEMLLSAAVADCFVLSFRALARARGLAWRRLSCSVEGQLERLEGQSRFTRFALLAKLAIDSAADRPRAQALLEQAEHGCLVANSLRAERVLRTEISCDAGA